MPRIVPKSAEFLADRTQVDVRVDVDYGVFKSAEPWRAIITIVYQSATGAASETFDVPVGDLQATSSSPAIGQPVPAKIVLTLTSAGAAGTRPAAAVALANPGHVFEGFYTALSV